jgi:hypothetical protein
MNKIIYKQKNKIGLALLVLGGVVSNVGVVSSASSSSSPYPTQEIQAQQGPVTGVNNPQLDITLNPYQIRAIDTGQNGGGPLLLSSSSGSTPIVVPTPATGITDASNPEIRVTWMSGDTITSFPKTTYLAAIESIRAALGETGRSIRLLDGIQPIRNEEQFGRVTGDIQCFLPRCAWSVYNIEPTSIAEQDQGVGSCKPKTSEVYIAELVEALNLPDLPEILRFVSEDPDNFMTDDGQATFRAHFPNLNGFSPRFFEVLSEAAPTSKIMIAQVDDMPRLPPPRTTDEESRIAEALKPKVIEALQLMLEDTLEDKAWYFGLNEVIARRTNNLLAILKRSVHHPLRVPGDMRNGHSSADLDAHVVENSSVHLHGEHVNLHDRCLTLEVWSQGGKRFVSMYFNQVEPSTFVCITRPDSPFPYR